MSAADVVVTSPGDACREARVIGRSIMLLDVVPGHGRENLGHELEMGSAAVSSPEPVLLRRALDSFLADPERSKPPVPPERGVAERQFIEALRGIGMDPKWPSDH
jgi:processive 1,2-diacylglycerol beta-glucosyltransferase